MATFMNIDRERMVEEFFQLVEIDSESGRERKMADLIKEKLQELGGRVREDDSGQKFGGNTGNIIADFPGAAGPVFLLSAHLDRIDGGGRIIPEVNGDYITNQARGAVGGDDVAGIVAILEILRNLQQDPDHYAGVKVIFTVAEEMAMLGAKQLSRSELNGVDYGLVFDGEGEVGTVINRSPLQLQFKYRIRGHEKQGIEANKIATSVLDHLRPVQENRDLEINIANSEGGIFSRKTKDSIEFTGGIKGLKRQLISEQMLYMQRILKEEAAKYGGEVEFEVEKLYPAFSLATNSDIIRTVMTAISREFQIQFDSASSGSDANIYNDKGLPTINLGIGLQDSHDNRERINIRSLKNLVKMILLVLARTKDS